MKPAAPLAVLALLAGCSQPRAPVAPPHGREVRFSAAQVARDREALELTAAYRARRSGKSETVVPAGLTPADRERRFQIMLHPELAPRRPVAGGRPVISGVDYVVEDPLAPSPANPEPRKKDR